MTHHTMTKPTFFIIGAQKAGTTALHGHLAQHPQVLMSTVKEPRYFALSGTNDRFRGPNDPAARIPCQTWDEYLTLFDDRNGARAVGESSTIYLHSPMAASRISESIPHAKLVAILRNPVDRAYSAYQYARKGGHERHTTFFDALHAEDERVAHGWGPMWHYRRRSLYADALEHYYNMFPREHVRVYLYEDLRHSPFDLWRDLCAFLEVDPSFVPDTSAQYNVSGEPRSEAIQQLYQRLRRPNRVKEALRAMVPRRAWVTARTWVADRLQNLNLRPAPGPTAAERAWLLDHVREDVERTQELIGRDLGTWLADTPGRHEGS